MKTYKFTAKEQAILALLSQCSGPLSADEIYERVWEEPWLASSSNMVAVHIARMRKKGVPIKTLWGRGYFLAED